MFAGVGAETVFGDFSILAFNFSGVQTTLPSRSALGDIRSYNVYCGYVILISFLMRFLMCIRVTYM